MTDETKAGQMVGSRDAKMARSVDRCLTGARAKSTAHSMARSPAGATAKIKA